MKHTPIVANAIPNGLYFCSLAALRKLPVILPILVLALTGSARAQQTWDPGLTTTSSFGSGTWDTTTPEWASGGSDAVWASGIATFAGTQSGTATVTLGAPITATALNFNTSGYDLVASATDTLTVTGSTTLAANVTAEIDGPGFSLHGGTLNTGSTLTLTGGGALTSALVSSGTLDITSGILTDNANNIAGTVNLTGTGEISGGLNTYNATTTNINLASNSSTAISLSSGSLNLGRGGSTSTINLISGIISTSGSNLIKVGNGDNSSVNGTINVEGGAINATSSGSGIIIDGVSANSGSANTGTGLLSLSSGTVNTNAIWFGNNTSLPVTLNNAGNAALTVTGGSLFIGSGGIVSNVTGQTQAINLSGGTIGASANWTSSMAMKLVTGTNGNVTFQLANNGTAFNIGLTGVLSGAGGLKISAPTQGGTLTLGATNTYTGNTEVEGNAQVTLTVNTALAALSTLTLDAAGVGGTVFDGTANLNYTGIDFIAGLTIDGVNLAPGIYGAGSSGVDGDLTGTGFLDVGNVAVPEPGTWALLLGGLGLLVFVRRLRRHNA